MAFRERRSGIFSEAFTCERDVAVWMDGAYRGMESQRSGSHGGHGGMVATYFRLLSGVCIVCIHVNWADSVLEGGCSTYFYVFVCECCISLVREIGEVNGDWDRSN